MKEAVSAIALAGAIGFGLNTLAHSIDIDLPGGSTKVAVAWQGSNTTVLNAFSGNTTIPEGTTLYIWDAVDQGYDVISYDFEEWSQPNYVIKPTQGFLIVAPTSTTLTMSGPDLLTTSHVFTMQSNQWYMVGHAYPRPGWLEKPNSPYAPSCNLNWPGLLDASNAGVADEYFRWSIGGQAWYWTKRADAGLEPNNPTGGYNNSGQYGARWRPPCATTGYQGNGFADQWIDIGQPVFVQAKVNRTWTMYRINDDDVYVNHGEDDCFAPQ